MLQFSQLSYQIDNRILINHVSGEIHDHDFIVITGQSGSGKSLLLKATSKPITYVSRSPHVKRQKFDRFDAGYLAHRWPILRATN